MNALDEILKSAETLVGKMRQKDDAGDIATAADELAEMSATMKKPHKARNNQKGIEGE